MVLGAEAALVLIRTSSSWSTSMDGAGGFRVFWDIRDMVG